MKLLFVIKSLSLPGGGSERVLAEISAGLTGRGHEVCVASFDAPGAADFYPFDPRVRRIRLGIGRPEKRSGPFVTLRRVTALRALAQHERPQVVVGFMHSAYVPLGIALVWSGLPVIASEHIVYDHYDDSPLARVLLRVTAAMFSAITAVSDAMRQTFPAFIRRRMVVIPNPVRIHRSGDSAGTGMTDGQNILLTVGRLEPQKDQATLIAAFAIASLKHDDWQLRIVGEGALRPKLAMQISELGLENKVTLAGPATDIHPEFARAALFVLPSLYESFGLATAEALAHGLPVIGFADCAGTNELVIDGVNGMLVRGEDRIKGLAMALDDLMNSASRRRRMGQRGPISVQAFRPAQIVVQWEALLQAVVMGRRSSDGPGETLKVRKGKS